MSCTGTPPGARPTPTTEPAPGARPALDADVLCALVDAVDAALWGGDSPPVETGVLLRVVPDPALTPSAHRAGDEAGRGEGAPDAPRPADATDGPSGDRTARRSTAQPAAEALSGPGGDREAGPDAGPSGGGTCGAPGRRGAGQAAGRAGAPADVTSGPEGGEAGDRCVEVAGELGLLPLGSAHPLDALLGLVAPAAWSAIGVATRGDGRPLDGVACAPGSGRGTASGCHAPGAREIPAEPVLVTLLVGRSGATAGVLRRAGGPPRRLESPPQGPVADACRRALGLATAPPPGGTAELWARWWLDRLVEAASRHRAAGVVPGWAETVARHPAAFVPLPGTGRPPLRPATPAPDPAAVATAAADLAGAWTWERLRTHHPAAALPGRPVSPQVARWMDDGMFARWQLSALPAAADLLDACHALLPEAVAGRVAAVVAADAYGAAEPTEPEADRCVG